MHVQIKIAVVIRGHADRRVGLVVPERSSAACVIERKATLRLSLKAFLASCNITALDHTTMANDKEIIAQQVSIDAAWRSSAF